MKVTEKQIRQVVREELRAKLTEAVDHESITGIVSGASKLLKAIDAFRTSAGAQAMNAVSPEIDAIASRLEDMVSNPGGYVERPPTQKIVSLRATKTEE